MLKNQQKLDRKVFFLLKKVLHLNKIWPIIATNNEIFTTGPNLKADNVIKNPNKIVNKDS